MSTGWGEEVKQRLDGVQARVEDSAKSVLVTVQTAKGLLRELRSYLRSASDERLLRDPPEAVFDLLKLSPSTDSTPPKGGADYAIQVGSVRNFKNDPSLPHFTRQDGAWFDFALTVRERKQELELLSYAFAIRFPNHPDVRVVRFDLNPKGHGNQERGLRSHVHLNVDDEGFAIPSPILAPLEVLDLLLTSLGATDGKTRAVRPSSV